MMTPDEFIADVAAVIAGLQVARSITRVPFGAALEPYDRLLHIAPSIGWHNAGDYEREIRRILGLPEDAAPSGITPAMKAGGAPDSTTEGFILRCMQEGS